MNARIIRRAFGRDELDSLWPAAISMALIVIALLFWTFARLQPSAFSEELYGRFALQFPAEFWAIWMGIPALMCWTGLRQPMRRWLVAVGALIQSLQFLALAHSTWATGGEPIIGAFCAVLFAPMHIALAWEAVKHHGWT